jgi:hypothetical protein
MEIIDENKLLREGMAAIDECRDFRFQLKSKRAKLARKMVNFYGPESFIKGYSALKHLYLTLRDGQLNRIIWYAFAKTACGYQCTITEENGGTLFEFRANMCQNKD